MSIKALALASIITFVSFSVAKAQVLTTGLLNLDGSNIINLGSVVYAYNLDYNGSAATVVLNGVTLTGINIFTAPSPNFTISGTGGYDNTGNGTTPSDAIYVLQENGAYYNLTLTLNNLTPGQTYAAQLTIGEQPGDDRTQSYTDGTVTSPTVNAINGPQYILDTFTATGTTETLQANVGDGHGAQLTGFVVEEIAVPEPGAWAMMSLGLVGLAIFGTRRRALFRS